MFWAEVDTAAAGDAVPPGFTPTDKPADQTVSLAAASRSNPPSGSRCWSTPDPPPPIPGGGRTPCRLNCWMPGRAGRMRIHAVHHPREHRRIWLDWPNQCRFATGRLLAEEESSQQAPRPCAGPGRWTWPATGQPASECFDISHTAGNVPGQLRVVFGDQVQSAQYRRSPNIDDITPQRRLACRHAPGAAAPLRQAGRKPCAMGMATRWVQSGAVWPRRAVVADGRQNPERWRAPADLVLVDGSLGQSQHKHAGVSATGAGSVALIMGVEKAEGHKVGLEDWCLPDGPTGSSGQDSAALMLVAQIATRAPPFRHHRMRSQQIKCIAAATGWRTLPVSAPNGAKLLQRFGGVRGV